MDGMAWLALGLMVLNVGLIVWLAFTSIKLAGEKEHRRELSADLHDVRKRYRLLYGEHARISEEAVNLRAEHSILRGQLERAKDDVLVLEEQLATARNDATRATHEAAQVTKKH